MARAKRPILIIDDDEDMRWALGQLLLGAGFEVVEAEAGRSGLEIAARCRPQTVLLDMRMPDLGGAEVLDCLRRFDPDLPVIIVTAHGSLSCAVSVIREGAFDFITKPFRNEHLLETVKRAVARRRAFRADMDVREGVTAVMGEGPSVQKLVDQIEAVVSTDYSVLIYGETGAGKDVVARALHQYGRRSTRPLVIVDCGAVTESLIASEFFGHEKGAFTGASACHHGYFESADGGTLFLDEIANLPSQGQKALLRTLENRTARRLGGTELKKIDVRAIAATNDDLKMQVKSGGFREDLLFRLNEYVIRVPPLRSRPEDIPFLAGQFLMQALEALRRPPIEIAPEAMDLFCSYRWPGNVRELRNVMRRVALTASRVITTDHLADCLGDSAPIAIPLSKPPCGASLRGRVRGLEREAVLAALDQARGNKTEAARILGIDYKTFRTKLKLLREREGALVNDCS